MMLALGNGSREGVPNMLLIITDGQSDDPLETWSRAVEARRQGINVIAVCISVYCFYLLSYIHLFNILSTVHSAIKLLAEQRFIALCVLY